MQNKALLEQLKGYNVQLCMTEEECQQLKKATQVLEVKRDDKEYSSTTRMAYYGLFESRVASGNATAVYSEEGVV